ncbi:protein NDNF [Aplysia californica]|uniref:Protein NDNF n=1 Tax=Aplysia californica TaxID=6500 RepID=A0ABM0ZVU8_APLCA|nr:protein NDNF [Aplysia californica]XP_012935602.1 protein NDNF [Aplysia californica]XP_012935604.1 protein NDNF [Aplysia californica]XP_035824579.1 protein NDNF [Aplysia californica]XP_035824580.1 protein NDNF [Aplysia californica]XP_035824581.1 protein NDNF [Aplysia californica]XP_035824582.1 protein NDNF [Aplysia californica]XP_035824583.1 protein NDNF [Aplysia californica]
MPMSELREIVVTVGQVLLLLLLLLLLVPESPAQSLPYRHTSVVPWPERSTFTDSHILLKDSEQDKYLFRGVPTNFTFTIAQNGSMLITITPCASEVSWDLYLKPDRKRRRGNWEGQQLRGEANVAQHLHHFKGDNRSTYHQMDAEAGAYIVVISSLKSDSYVKILVTANPNPLLTGFYPALSNDNALRAETRKRNIVVNWQHGNSANQQWSRSVEYCIVISRLRNFKSHCGALAYLHGDKRPKFTNWGFPGQRQKQRELRRKAKPIKKESPKMIFHQCVGNKTSFTYAKARRAKKYFVDVFVIDKDSNRASAYRGTSVKIGGKKRNPNIRMKVGETKTVNLKKKKGVIFKLKRTVPKLGVEVIPCAGKTPFEITYKGKKIKSKTIVRRWKSHVIHNAKPGTYLMTFPGKRRKKSYVTVYLTSTPTRSKLTLPKKTKIHVFEKLTTCSKVTLAWMGTDVEQNYCLYKKALNKKGQDSRKDSCMNAAERPTNDRQLCTSHSSQDPKRQVVAYNVTGLNPGTWYRFDVFVSIGNSASVQYRSVKVKTQEDCNG